MTNNPLAQPIEINGIKIKNRLVRSAVQENMADKNGIITQNYIDYYDKLSAGGIGLIITGHMYVNLDGRSCLGMTGADSDKQIPNLRKMVDIVHKNGAVIFAQLNHTGLKAFFEKEVHKNIKGPSKIVWTAALELDEIEKIIEDFGKSAARVKKAGFDGIQIHGAHNYLIAQFLSKVVNKRKDKYGGSLENRQRFCLEVYQSIRDSVGDDFPVMIKLDSYSRSYSSLPPLLRSLIKFEDALDTAKRLEAAGINAIEVTCGFNATKGAVSYKLSYKALCKANSEEFKAAVGGAALTPVDWILNHNIWFKPHHNIEHIKLFKQNSNIPILGSSCFRDPLFMRKVIQNKWADMICMARPMIYDIDFPKKILGESEEPSKCLNCNICLLVLPGGKPTICYYGKKPY